MLTLTSALQIMAGQTATEAPLYFLSALAGAQPSRPGATEGLHPWTRGKIITGPRGDKQPVALQITFLKKCLWTVGGFTERRGTRVQWLH